MKSRKQYFTDQDNDIYVFRGSRSRLGQRYFRNPNWQRGCLGLTWTRNEIEEMGGKRITRKALPADFRRAFPRV